MSLRSKHHGVIIPMVTPFSAADSIDEPAVERIVDYLIAGGVDGVFVLGTTGEAASIAADQRTVLAGAAVRAARQRVTTYAGISGNCVTESIEMAKRYRDLGIDAVVAHPPFSYALSDSAMEAYFRGLADQIPLPLIIYNIPKTTHVSIPLGVVAKLLHHPNIPAIKDSENSPQRLTALVQLASAREGFSVLAGTAAVFAHTLKAGGHGVVPGSGNLCPELYARLYAAALDRDWDEVDRISAETIAITAQYQLPDATLGESLARLKALMSAKGLCTPAMLPPLLSASELSH